jgi:hypothetical protein
MFVSVFELLTHLLAVLVKLNNLICSNMYTITIKVNLN